MDPKTILTSLASVSLISSAAASVTMTLQIGELRDHLGFTVDNNVVGILVADTNGNGFDFENTLNGTALSAGNSIDGDLILQTFQVDIAGNGFAGVVGNAIFDVTTSSPAGTSPVGNQLAFLWFEASTTLGDTVSLGDYFGTITNQLVNANSGGTIGTTVPADSTTPTLAYLDNILTGDTSGLDNTFFTGTDQVGLIPEPSSVALLGLGSVALLLRRRR